MPYNANDARQFVQNRIGSSEKAKEIGFKYEYSLEDGLKKLIEWRKKENYRSIKMKMNIPITKAILEMRKKLL